MGSYTLSCEVPGYTHLNGELASRHLSETVEGLFCPLGAEAYHLRITFGWSFVETIVEADTRYIPCKSAWAEIRTGLPFRAGYVRYKPAPIPPGSDPYEEVSGQFLAD